MLGKVDNRFTPYPILATQDVSLASLQILLSPLNPNHDKFWVLSIQVFKVNISIYRFQIEFENLTLSVKERLPMF